MDVLCIHSPCWFQQELNRNELSPRTGVGNGSSTLFFDTQTTRTTKLCTATGQEDETGKEEKEKELSGWISQGASASASSYVSSLKACAQRRDLDRGRALHNDAVEMGLLDEEYIGSSLINMYAKCGSILEAQDVFDELSSKNVFSWTTLITGYAEYGQSEVALACYERMKCDGISADRITFISILRACGNLGAVEKSQEIHAEILKRGMLDADTVLGTALIDVYAKCKLISKASEVFEVLFAPDLVAWNALITGYACCGHGQEAVDRFEQMQSMCVSPNAITFSATLKACGILAAPDKGQAIHAKVLKEGLFTYEAVASTLVDMYAKCGKLTKAAELFDELPTRNIVTWNALIAGHTQNGQGEEALKCYSEMQLEAFYPDAFTYTSILKASGIAGMANKGLELHADIAREGVFDNNFVVGSALVDMYAKFGLLVEAQEVFDNLSCQNVISWSALIVGYANHGHGHQALSCYDQMLTKGCFPNVVTLLGILKACGSIGASCRGQGIHAEIVIDELLERDIVLGTALVDMYAKCGLLTEAQDVFDELPQRDIISWNALLGGYSQYMHADSALHCFQQMQLRGIPPDTVTFVCVLKACGCIGAAWKAQEIHNEFVRDGILETDLVIGNSMIDIYACCGMLSEAQNVFDCLPVHDLVSWNTLIAGYAQLGKDEAVFDWFNRLVVNFNEPDSHTFTAVLNTCSHLGLIDKGKLFFATMCTSYAILPTVEHYACLIDLYSRTGHIESVSSIMKDSPFAADVLVWSSFLGACQRRGSMKHGRWAFEHMVQLKEKDSTVYVCMSNLIAASNRQESHFPIKLKFGKAEAEKLYV